jgi:hypothetical protein
MGLHPYIISNAAKSQMFEGFKHKIYPFRDFKVEQANSVISLPLIGREDDLLAVIVLFNKVNADHTMSFFTDDDTFILKSIGILIESVI